MKIKKQDKKNMIKETGETNGRITEKTQTVEKPLRAEKLLAQKTFSEKASSTEKPNTTKSPKTAANSATCGNPKSEPLGIKKKYIESRNICEVTFRLHSEASLGARKATVVGDFNNWEKEATPLTKQENGDFIIALELDTGTEYRFRYLIDGQRWENDWHADKYVKSPYDVEDSVVVCTAVAG
ncbi:MAG TPA: isoamylase early set domain-containing protein [Dissulfurispiraceae bacterium]|nr:isoamylase early set domain-containing protein [Dissulfurispiraceae bacterium]